MQERNGVKEVSLDEARGMMKDGGARFVWLGREPLSQITKLLKLDPSKAMAARSGSIMDGNSAEMEKLRGAIFACYHGKTSEVVVKTLKARFGVDAYSLKGGVTAAVGEIF